MASRPQLRRERYRISASKSVVGVFAIKDLDKGEFSLEILVESVKWNQAIQCLSFHFIPKAKGEYVRGRICDAYLINYQMIQ